ncbi:hypothetical protein roselon_00161 [Roseibacterium elongatum DSM 19469]|uniref:Ada DNA repair metal-binding domain-containing protein n=1 Tax=Roseicyclus elongatus DSM 19469 TaxID=1294273 RepID=W8RNN6_9RHOB|nr:hypothetical protein roselon_00161 [Roseibacterium elongatum DSM 19469]
MMGNRGILHDAQRRLGTARWRHKAWVCCALSFKGRQRKVMTPGTYTELFFLDEAVAMAAGHRPCAECRRADYTRFARAWATAAGQPARAPGMDAALHAARITPRTRDQLRHRADWADLPDGAFALDGGHACLVHGRTLYPFTVSGYGKPRARPATGRALICTPAPMVDVLRAGYGPRLHPSMGGA